jgi:hypothetical protein
MRDCPGICQGNEEDKVRWESEAAGRSWIRHSVGFVAGLDMEAKRTSSE